MLITIFVALLLINAILLYSLRYTRAVLHPAEIIVNWLMFASISEHWYYVLTLTWKLVWFDKKLMILLILVLNRVFLMSTLTVWALFGWFHNRWSAYQKTVFIAWWFVLVSGTEYSLHALGFTTYIRWNQGFRFADQLTMLILLLSFAHGYRYLLLRERSLP